MRRLQLLFSSSTIFDCWMARNTEKYIHLELINVNNKCYITVIFLVQEARNFIQKFLFQMVLSRYVQVLISFKIHVCGPVHV